ncbi:MAG: hypothetical protein LM587_03670, partial [Candidatus Aenigmarchaeota archaeon]|nr:hypothetical protein [Candidatus Aenigmarchaeota archaeon]
ITTTTSVTTTTLPSQTYLTIFTDKSNYTSNETINIFGELVVNGERVNATANLSLQFNSSLLLSKEIEIINGNFNSSLLANFSEDGIYSLIIDALGLKNETTFYFVSYSQLQTIPTLKIEAFSSVKNITKGKGDWKVVSIYGNVNYNGSLVNSKVKLRVKDVKGEVVFEDEKFVNGSFNFTFEVLPKAYGKYSAEIFAESESGNASKTLDFNVLKHIKVKPKVKQEKFNYELGEKIRFEISAIDEDTGEIFPNATLQAFVVDPNGNITEVNYTQVGPGKFVVELDAEREFRPGLYKLKVKLSYVSPNPGEEVVEEEVSFAVGLVNVNTPKSIYLPGEEVKIIVGVLNSQGKRAYDANVTLIVRSPSGGAKVFNSYNGDFATDELDGSIFVLYNETSETGRYNISVVSVESDVVTTYETFFEVREFVEFDIERKMKTLIDVGHPNTNFIKIKSNVNARNVTIIEKIPNEFLEVVVYNGRIERKENETWLIWSIPYLNVGDEKTLKYEFTTPDVKPAIYLAGPISVFYNNSLEFDEVRDWTFIVVDVVYYFFKLMPYYKTDVLQYPVDAVHHLVYNSYEVYRDAIVMCRNNFNYTLRWVLFDEADDDAGVLQDWELQVATPAWQPITSTGTNGWQLYPGETNPHTSISGIGTGDTCTKNPTTANGDKCEWDGKFVWNITITPSAPLGLNKIRLLPKTRTTGSMFDTNIIHTYLIDCAYPYDVNLIRPIKIFSPTGEPIDRVVRGHVARIVVPLANYNTSFDKTVNVSIKILNTQTNEEQNWYVVNGNSRQVTIPKTLSPPNWNFSVVTFTVLVPDDIQPATYKVIVNISSQYSSVAHEKSFDVYTDDSGVTSDIALFVATPRKQGANCENNAGNSTCNPGYTPTCGGANYCFRDWRLIYVCNYGDYNLTVNVTDQSSGAHQYYTTESTAAYPQPNFNDTTTGSVLKWYNVKLNTSTCFKAAIPYRPTDDTGEENYFLTAEWQDPVTGELKSVTKQFTALISASTGTKNPTIAAELNVTSAFPNQQLPLRIITKFGGTDYATTIEGTRGALIHYIEIFIPPGFSKPTSFKIIDANGAAVRTVNPDP